MGLQVFQEVQHLCADRHVKRRDRFVADNQLRLDGDGPRNGDALALSAREFMRIAACMLGLQSDLLQQVANADGLVIATPVYKASFSGALKTVLDLLPERALAHKIVLPMATGGSIAHMLAVDYALKPVLSALKAQELLHGIFAEDSQIAYGEGSAQAQLVPVLEQRLHEALETLYSAMARRPKPLDPNVLNDRLLSARWSI